MKELSMHILDIIENSQKAEATLIKLMIIEDLKKDLMTIKISDNGKGIPKETLKSVRDPFTTSRKTRPVGLGLSLFEAAANRSGGEMKILSKENLGTVVKVTLKISDIDRAPLGNMANTISSVVMGLGDGNFLYRHIYNGKVFNLDTRELREMLGEKVPLNSIKVVSWLKEYVKENLNELYEEHR
ncbi:ATP-binding protein [Alkalibacter mobilis]|uniref:ATP-binding protein n=1 Tax=Alkalibacter mobilis TaxID=2787712 RepID=UPI00189CC0F7|nr:ATP-binding protein [Alkalibacter mobilis]MBF7097853.1 sensor histidine kinase [Alkalibacter mobilis]